MRVLTRRTAVLACVMVMMSGLLRGEHTRTISGSCDTNGNCKTPTTGVTAQAKIACTNASGSGAPVLNTCSVKCVVNCGNFILKKGDDAVITNGGTITLTCSGQAPTSCTLKITEKDSKAVAK